MGKNILVPVDASSQARKAFEFALDEFEDAQLTVFHVIDPVDPGHLPGVELDLSPDDEGYAEEVADRYLDDFIEDAKEKGVGATKEHTKSTNPSREIVEYAEENDIDHIVMGSHGRTGASRILLGSVAEKVTRRSPTPVTVVR